MTKVGINGELLVSATRTMVLLLVLLLLPLPLPLPLLIRQLAAADFELGGDDEVVLLLSD